MHMAVLEGRCIDFFVLVHLSEGVNIYFQLTSQVMSFFRCIKLDFRSFFILCFDQIEEAVIIFVTCRCTISENVNAIYCALRE